MVRSSGALVVVLSLGNAQSGLAQRVRRSEVARQGVVPDETLEQWILLAPVADAAAHLERLQTSVSYLFGRIAAHRDQGQRERYPS